MVKLYLIATVVVFALILYLTFAPRFHPEFVNRVAFYPGPEEAGAEQYLKIGAVQAERVMIPVSTRFGDRQISAAFFEKPGAKFVTLYSHGNAGSMLGRWPKVACLLDAGSSVLMYDYAGYGKSPGQASMEAVAADGIAAYDYLAKIKHFKSDQIVLYGESIGGGVSSEIARARDSCGLILDCTFLSPAAWAKKRIGPLNIYPDALLMHPSLNVQSLFPSYKGAVLVIKPGHDDVIPTSHSDTLYAAATGTKQLLDLPTSPHGWVQQADMPLYAAGLKEFYRSLTPAAMNK